MRWFKHMTASWDDEKLARLTDAYGLEGYGFWWRTVECVAAAVDDGKNSATYSAKKWGKLAGLSAKKWQNLAEFCAKLGLFSLEFSENEIAVIMPNIVKFRDEYQRKQDKKSGQNPERVRHQNTEAEADTEAEEEKEILHSVGEDADTVPAASPDSIPVPVYDLPLKGKAGHSPRNYPVTKELFDTWQEACPLVDVRHELKEIKAWLASNPSRRPAKDMARFVNLWLAREQDKQANRQARETARASPAQPQSWIDRQNEQTRREIEALERGLVQ